MGQCEEVTNSFDILKAAKEKFINEEQQYLKNKPLSEEIGRFIMQYKKRHNELRGKRNEGKAKSGVPIAPVEDDKLAFNGDFGQSDEKSLDISTNAAVRQEPRAALQLSVTMPEVKDIERLEDIRDDAFIPAGAQKEESQDNVLFEQVVKDVDKLMKFKNEGKFGGREGALCNVSGTWDSQAGGAQLELNLASVGECGERKVHIKLSDRMPPADDGFLCNGEWKLTGEVPFSHSTVIIVTGVNRQKKKAVTFIGECRICEGKEGITGIWMIGRASTSCNDRESTHLTISDIWRKNNIKKLQDSHMEAINNASLKSQAAALTGQAQAAPVQPTAHQIC